MADTANTSPVESAKDFGDQGGVSVHQRWMTEISVAQKEFRDKNDWYEVGAKVVQRYRDERKDQLSAERERKSRRYNILWANVSLLAPALYSRTPKPEVVRRFKDRDPVARAAATMLERAVAYTIDSETQDFDETMASVVMDRLLPGRGTAWVRYEPVMRDVTPRLSVEMEEGERYRDESGAYHDGTTVERDDDGLYVTGETYQEVEWEKVCVDYVHWRDFLHSPARVWSEVRWVARRSYMTRDRLKARFGKVGEAVELTYRPVNITEQDEEGLPHHEVFKKAVVWEIWDRDAGKVFWISPGYAEGPLDTRDDPLDLPGFWPCPKPLFATTTTDNLVPVPDYIQYLDQAAELDTLTTRAGLLMKALKVGGVYNSEFKAALATLLDSAENVLVPVDAWAAFADKGGVQGQIDFLPIQEVATVLQTVLAQREQVKQDLYEITGLSDIMRGATDADETLGAQQLKGRYGTLRMRTSVEETQRFARDLLRIIACVVAKHFSAETIRDIAGMELPSRDEVAAARQAVSDLEDRESKLRSLPPEQAQQIVAQIPAPPKSEIDHLHAVANDVPFEDAVELLRSDGMRSFRLDVETDSTLAVDEQEERRNRTEFLATVNQFLANAVQLTQSVPEFVPVMSEMLAFGVRGYKVGRQLEDTLEDAMEAIQRRIDQAKDAPQENPAVEQMRREQDREDAKAKAEIERAGQEQKVRAASLAGDARKIELQEEKQADERAARSRELDLRERELAVNSLQKGVAIDGGGNPVDAVAALDEAARLLAAQKAVAQAPKRIHRDGSGKVVALEVVGVDAVPRRVIRDRDDKIVGLEGAA